MNSRPSNTTEPGRLAMIPMIAFKVVVWPAPLRPSSVTTSPSPTAKRMPCRMWLSPYQALSPSTRSSAFCSTAASGMTGSHIGLDHLGIGRHLLVAALGQDLAAGQHGDGVREIRHHGKVVLHHQHRAALRHGADEIGDAADVLVPHARHRLVPQQHPPAEGGGGGGLPPAPAPAGRLRPRAPHAVPPPPPLPER